MAYFLKYKAGNNKELLTKNTGDPIAKAANGHEYIDLGLPSGTLWAKYNVGALTENDRGLYFRWGETLGYTDSLIEDPYKYLRTPSNMNEEIPIGIDEETPVDIDKGFPIDEDPPIDIDTGSAYTKYNSSDNKTILDLEDDAARVNMGGKWLMPTKEQILELINNTTITGNRGDNIIILTSQINGNSMQIKLPCGTILGRELPIGKYNDSTTLLTNYMRIMKDGETSFAPGARYSEYPRRESANVRGVLKIN